MGCLCPFVYFGGEVCVCVCAEYVCESVCM